MVSASCPEDARVTSFHISQLFNGSLFFYVLAISEFITHLRKPLALEVRSKQMLFWDQVKMCSRRFQNIHICK